MNHNDLIQQKDKLYLEMPSQLKFALALFFLIGVGALVGGFAVGEETRTWGSFLFNLMFFFSIALGGVAFGGMQEIISAKWGRPIKRLHESFGAFIPVASVLFVVYLVAIKFDILGAGNVYSWIADPHLLDYFYGKRTWLQPNFMIIRDFFAVFIIFWLARWHMKKTVAADALMLRGDVEGSLQEGARIHNTLRYWSAPVLVVHSFAFSLLAFDLTMSLAPTWFSTLWGGWSFAIMMQTLMATILIFMYWLKNKTVGQFFKRQQFHDIGKLMHGFTVFFAYLTYAHFLTYWYINMPEETSYFIARLKAPWIYFVMASPFLSFLIPFFLLIPKVGKWVGPLTIPICCVILLAQWLNYMLVVIPEVADAGSWNLPWIELGVFFGFLALFLGSFFVYARKVPVIAISDPLLKESMESGH